MCYPKFVGFLHVYGKMHINYVIFFSTLIPKVSRTLRTVPRLSRTRTNKSWNAFVELGRACRAVRKDVRLAAYKKS